MKNKDEMDMMHYLYMIASKWSYRDWKTDGYPYFVPKMLNLGGTPLNHAIVGVASSSRVQESKWCSENSHYFPY